MTIVLTAQFNSIVQFSIQFILNRERAHKTIKTIDVSQHFVLDDVNHGILFVKLAADSINHQPRSAHKVVLLNEYVRSSLLQ